MTRIQDAAQALHQDWQTKAPFENIAQGFGVTSAEQAYDVQAALQKLHVPSRGAIVGRKIALASKVMQQMIGFDQPISGAIFTSDVMQSPANVPADAFGRLGVECELAVELNADVAPQPTAFTAASVDGLIATVRPAFELIEDRKADYATLDPLTLIADNAWCGGVVLGPELGGWNSLDLADIASALTHSGQDDEAANTGAADPLGSLAWVLNHFGVRGVTLQKGEMIITGSAVRTRFPERGDRLRYDVAGACVEMQVV